jgi:molybdopterin-binding protein
MTTFKIYLKNGDIITEQAASPETLRLKYGAGAVAKIKKTKGT